MRQIKADRPKKVKEQQLLFSEEEWLPDALPCVQELKPSFNLSAVFNDCHNYVYANEGLLKDKIFHEMVKLLVMKLDDEQNSVAEVQFGITAAERRALMGGQENAFTERLDALYQRVRRQHTGLEGDHVLRLPPLTLAYVVGRLQFVSLQRTPGDVKGEAFQVFVNRHQRGGRGEFFTPHPVVRLAVEMIAPRPHEKIIDPACGSGGFLMRSVEHVLRHHSETQREEYIRECVRGIEFNPDVALSAAVRLEFEGGRGDEVLCANALGEHASLEGTFDVVLTNPPFGAKGRVEDRRILKSYALARRWQAGKSGWEPTPSVLAGQAPDILFIEQSLRLLRPGGRMAIVLPDGLLQNISNGHIRHWLRHQARVLAVVSLPQETFIPYGTGVKTSLLLVQKLPSDDPPGVFMTRMTRLGYDVKGQPIHRRGPDGGLVRTETGEFAVDDDVDEIAAAYRAFRCGEALPSDSAAFIVDEARLASRLDAEYYLPDDLAMIERLQASGAKPLSQIADIVSVTDGFRLGADAEIRYIAISDVDARTMQVVTQQVIRADEAPSRASYRLCPGDIITAVSGASTGTRRQATALIGEEEAGAICSNGFAVLRNVQGVNPLFLLAFMRTDCFLRQVRRLMTGHAIPAISSDDLARVLAPIPPPDAQQTVARSVGEIQDLRRQAFKAGERVVAETQTLIEDLSRAVVSTTPSCGILNL